MIRGGGSSDIGAIAHWTSYSMTCFSCFISVAVLIPENNLWLTCYYFLLHYHYHSSSCTSESARLWRHPIFSDLRVFVISWWFLWSSPHWWRILGALSSWNSYWLLRVSIWSTSKSFKTALSLPKASSQSDTVSRITGYPCVYTRSSPRIWSRLLVLFWRRLWCLMIQGAWSTLDPRPFLHLEYHSYNYSTLDQTGSSSWISRPYFQASRHCLFIFLAQIFFFGY